MKDINELADAIIKQHPKYEPYTPTDPKTVVRSALTAYVLRHVVGHNVYPDLEKENADLLAKTPGLEEALMERAKLMVLDAML